MKQLCILFLALIFKGCFFALPTFAQEETEDETEPVVENEKRKYSFLEKEKFERLRELETITFPEGSFSRIHWMVIEYYHTKKKDDKSPSILLSGGQMKKNGIASTYFPQTTMNSSDLFDNQAREFGRMADNTDDSEAKSAYRQLEVGAHSASIANLEREQAMERNMAALELAASVGNVLMKGLGTWASNSIRKDYNKVIDWAFNPDGIAYSDREDAPVLIFTIIIDHKPGKDKPYRHQWVVEAKAQYEKETIALPTQSFSILYYNKKLREKMKEVPTPEGYISSAKTQLITTPGLETYLGIQAAMLRQTAHDFRTLQKVLEADQ